MDLKDIEKKLQDIDQALLKCEIDTTEQDDISTYIALTDSELSLMTPEDCNEFSLRILQHTLYIQRKLNKCVALRDYCKAQLRQAVSKRISQFSSRGTSWEYAEQQAINECAFSTSLNERIMELNLFITSTNNLVNILDKISKKVDGIKYGKR